MNRKVCSVTIEPTNSSSKHASSFKDSSALLNTEQLSGELHMGEVFLIASTRLVMKTENIYQNTRKMHITMETEPCI